MKSYLKFLSRNKLYTAIEAEGLVVSLAFVIIIACYTWQQFAVTREAKDYKRLYALSGGQEWISAWPGELAAVVDRVPDVEAAGRINLYGTSVRFNDKQDQNPDVYEIDPEIFEFLPPNIRFRGCKCLAGQESGAFGREVRKEDISGYGSGGQDHHRPQGYMRCRRHRPGE